MSGRELDQHTLAVALADARILRRAAVRIADGVAAEHPHPLDDVMPKLAGRQLAQDPAVSAGLLELLDAIGYTRKERK